MQNNRKRTPAFGRESHRRSIFKSVTFRIIIVISDITVIYLLTHTVTETIALTIYTNIASTVLYYGHERIWNRIGWERKI